MTGCLARDLHVADEGLPPHPKVVPRERLVWPSVEAGDLGTTSTDSDLQPHRPYLGSQALPEHHHPTSN